MKLLGDYLKSRRQLLLLLGPILALILSIYSLYDLPPGPALYTGLMVTAAAVCFGAADLPRFREERRRWEEAQAWEPRCRQAEEKADRDLAAARDYYTRWSHQIKTPLSAMRLLLEEDPADRGELGLELLKTEQYVEMALSYQRLGASETDLVLRQYSLEDMVKQAVRRLAPLFIHKKLSLRLGALDRTLLTDEKWLVFLLEQLLSNAVKYTPSGTVSVYLADSAGTDSCTLAVEDTGIGIQQTDLPRIFDWGYTGCNGRLDKRATGVGLALCKQAGDLLGYTLTAESDVGKGTRVLLNLSRPTLEIE